MCSDSIPDNVREMANVLKFIMEDLDCSVSEAMMVFDRADMYRKRVYGDEISKLRQQEGRGW